MKALLTILLLLATCFACHAEVRRFQNADETKSFFGELVKYDEKKKLVHVRMKNGRVSKFKLELLSKDDQAYAIKQGKILAIGSDIRIRLEKFKDKSRKDYKERIENRIYPSGYTISLSNRAKKTYSNITVKYTLYYAVQGYLEPERENKEKSGELVCEKITSQGTVPLKTEAIDIITGKLEPVIKHVRKKSADGQEYVEPVVEKAGGNRKDLLLGCKVELMINGEVVKTETDGTIQIESTE